MLEYIPKNKFELFIKIKSKIMVYQLILYIIYDELDMAFDAVILLIKYLSNNALFSLEEKTKFYWKYINYFSFICMCWIDPKSLLGRRWREMHRKYLPAHYRQDHPEQAQKPRPIRAINNANKEIEASKLRYNSTIEPVAVNKSKWNNVTVAKGLFSSRI